VKSFPHDLRFIHEWRTYQKRVLEDLQDHLSNAHLHVVAAPGAGKTVLGLEVIRRLNRRTLVLVPSLTIRNQWVHHYGSLFQSADSVKDELVDTSLTEPAFLTVATYQSLHAAKKNRDNGIADLTGIETLVLDEAHHLRNEWWKVLVELKQQLDGVQVIALTATPPYDVPPREWNRYFEMCGPIDSIISVPELVKEGNLCPHADFVYFSLPTEPEREKIRTFRRQLAELKEWLLESKDFSRSLLGHPWVSNFDSDTNQEDILGQPELFAALVIFLHYLGHDCSAQKEFLGLAEHTVPQPADEWYEVLLSEMISRESDRFDSTPEFRRELNRRLAVMHAVERRRVTFVSHKALDKSLRNSESKLKVTLDIFELEHDNLGESLRMVILTDFIRKEFLAPGSQDKKSRRLGAVPVFESIREKYGSTVPMALLTGSLIILPGELADEFFRQVRERDPDIQKPRTIPLLSDPDYVSLKLDQSIRQVAVGAITDLFNLGELRTIVGTIALLGEGWDAPATNTLVMASASSTYVQTNQVRGRAIRIDPNEPEKISSIWHLACVETTAPGGGSDFQKIRSRFSAFEGLSYSGDRILSGFERLFSLPIHWSDTQVESMNAVTRKLANNRLRISEGWRSALMPRSTALRSGLVEEVQGGSRSITALQIFRHPQQRSALPAAVLAGYAPAAIWVLPALELGVPQLAIIHGTVLATLTVGLQLPRLARDWWQVLRLGMGPVTLGRVAEVIRMTLIETGMLQTPAKQLSLHYADAGNGRSTCFLQGGTLNESDLFIRCMEEVLDPVDNPRYLMFRPHPSRKKANKGEGDFHSVPSALARKEQANVLLRYWKKHLGPCELIFTRRKAGRKMLLKARARAWVSLNQKVTDRQSVWK
jgi:superfamily II DNA or RNA helicase